MTISGKLHDDDFLISEELFHMIQPPLKTSVPGVLNQTGVISNSVDTQW